MRHLTNPSYIQTWIYSFIPIYIHTPSNEVKQAGLSAGNATLPTYPISKHTCPHFYTYLHTYTYTGNKSSRTERRLCCFADLFYFRTHIHVFLFTSIYIQEVKQAGLSANTDILPTYPISCGDKLPCGNSQNKSLFFFLCLALSLFLFVSLPLSLFRFLSLCLSHCLSMFVCLCLSPDCLSVCMCVCYARACTLSIPFSLLSLAPSLSRSLIFLLPHPSLTLPLCLAFSVCVCLSSSLSSARPLFLSFVLCCILCVCLSLSLLRARTLLFFNIHTSDTTHSYVWHDSLNFATWLIHMCDMTHSSTWHDSFICVT